MARNHYIVFNVDDGDLVAELIIDAQLGAGTQVALPMLSRQGPRKISRTGVWEIIRNPAIVISPNIGESPIKLLARMVGELPKFANRDAEYDWIQAWEQVPDLPEGTS